MNDSAWYVARPAFLSFKLDRRVPLVCLVLVSVVLIGLVITVGVGQYPIAPLDVIRTVLGLPTDNGDYRFIVNTLRLPRALVAAMVGMALGVAGAIMQGLTRNPLAAPEITGVTAGASLAVVFFTVTFPSLSAAVLPVAAYVGGLMAAGLIYILAWRHRHTPIGLILTGIGLSALLGAGTSLMITFADINDVQRALIWLAGSVYARSWEEFHAMLPWLAFGLSLALSLARDLDALALGEDLARGLGASLAAKRSLLLLACVVLVSASVATAGAVGFVGLLAPHIARRLVGRLHLGMLVVAGLVGALLVVLADLIGRTLFAPIEIPCGIVTAIIGVPFFLYLLVRIK